MKNGQIGVNIRDEYSFKNEFIYSKKIFYMFYKILKAGEK